MQGEGSSNTGTSLTEADKKQIAQDQPKADDIAQEYSRIATHCQNKNIDMGWFSFIKIPPKQMDDETVDPEVHALRKIEWDRVGGPNTAMDLDSMFALCFKMLEIAPKVGRRGAPTSTMRVFRAKAKFLHPDKVKKLHPGVNWCHQDTSLQDAAAACYRVIDISAQVTEHFLKLRIASNLVYDREYRSLAFISL
jgi:hypothetical protein